MHFSKYFGKLWSSSQLRALLAINYISRIGGKSSAGVKCAARTVNLPRCGITALFAQKHLGQLSKKFEPDQGVL